MTAAGRAPTSEEPSAESAEQLVAAGGEGDAGRPAEDQPPLLVRAAACLLCGASLFVAARASLTLLGGYRLDHSPPTPLESQGQLLAGALVLAGGLTLYVRSGLWGRDLDQLSPRSDQPAPQRSLARANVLAIALSLLGVVAAFVCMAWR